MQLRLEQGAVRVLAGENPFLEYAFFEQIFHGLANILEVLASFVFHAAVGVTCGIASEAAAAATEGRRRDHILAFAKLSEAKLEDPGAVPVDEHDAEERESAQQVRE